MRSASRQARRLAVLGMIVVATATICVSLPAVSANQPSDLRLVSMTRSGGQLTAVVSVPVRFLSAVGAPGGLTVDGPSGEALAPTVTPLTPSDTAVAIVVHTAGASPEGGSRAWGTVAELIRSLDPGVAVTVATTTGGVLMTPMTADRAVAFAALSQPVPDAPVALSAALSAAVGQLGSGRYVDPLLVMVDAGATNEAVAPADLPSLTGIGVRIIPVAVSASPLAAQLGQRLGLAVPAGADPVALVDDAVGWVSGRIRVSVADPGAGTMTIRAHGGATELALPIALVPPTVPTTAIAATTPTTVPVVLAERSTPAPAAVVPAAGAAVAVTSSAPAAAVAVTPPAAASSSSSWMVVLGTAVAIVGVGSGAVLVARRRADTRDVEESAVLVEQDPASEAELDDDGPPEATPALLTDTADDVGAFHYKDLSDPVPSARTKARPRREVFSRPPPRPPVTSNGSAEAPAEVARAVSKDAAFARRVQVLALAQELGNVSEACRVVGVSRRSYYEWKRIADEHGIEALRPK